jgi:hypothetical protein
MKREVKMTFNPSYAELLGREQYKIRLEEAKRERLINTLTLANPSLTRKIWLILLDRMQTLWHPKRSQKNYHPISRIEGKSHSL